MMRGQHSWSGGYQPNPASATVSIWIEFSEMTSGTKKKKVIRKIPEEDDNGYLSAVLRLNLELPETPSRAGPQDKQCAAALHARGIKLATVESALLLASLRRLGRPSDMPPLSPIRSLAYFFPVIQELLDNPIPDGYLEYLRKKVRLLGRIGQITKCS